MTPIARTVITTGPALYPPRTPRPPRTGLTTHRRRSATHLMHRVSGRGVPAATDRRPVGEVMGLHKLTAGDGYTYIAKPAIAADVSEVLQELADSTHDPGSPC
jgi:hypothetical protein